LFAAALVASFSCLRLPWSLFGFAEASFTIDLPEKAKFLVCFYSQKVGGLREQINVLFTARLLSISRT